METKTTTIRKNDSPIGPDLVFYWYGFIRIFHRKHAMLNTERHSPRSRGLDTWPREDILAALWDGQMAAIASLRPVLPALAGAAAAIEARLARDGRLIYAGAGSSGMLALQDAMELGPTYGWPAERLAVLLAGGPDRITPASMPGAAEDEGEEARRELGALKPNGTDVVIAVAASGETPYTVAALEAGRDAGCLTVGIANNPDTALLRASDHPILLDTGPEAIAGSTRMGAGTAQKAALGLLSTLVQVKRGRVVDGHMIDLLAENAKLRRRARRMVADLAGVDENTAAAALDATGGHAKPAVLIALGQSPDATMRLLDRHNGSLRAAMTALRA